GCGRTPGRCSRVGSWHRGPGSIDHSVPPPHSSNRSLDAPRQHLAQNRPVVGVELPDLLVNLTERFEEVRRLAPIVDLCEWAVRTIGVHADPLLLGEPAPLD